MNTRQILESAMLPVWTPKSDSTPVFIPLVNPKESVDVQQVNWQYWLGASVGTLEVQPWCQFSDDLLTWSDGERLLSSDTWNSAEGWAYSTGFTGITGVSDTSKRYVRFGLKVRNTSGSSALAYARVQLRLQTRA